MSQMPDLDDLTLPELQSLQTALVATEAAAAVIEAASGNCGEGGFEVSLFADEEGVSVTFTVPVNPKGAA